MKWFLDTNICIDFLKGRFPLLIEAMQKTSPVDVLIPAVVEAELLLGAKKSVQSKKNLEQVQRFLSHFPSVPFDRLCTAIYADVRSSLEKRGTPIGPNDLLIAAIVLAHGGTLVTSNIKEFSRVKGLKLENWTEISF
jgi:tRNA(fMet)-specific endonuclease VapC